MVKRFENTTMPTEPTHDTSQEGFYHLEEDAWKFSYFEMWIRNV